MSSKKELFNKAQNFWYYKNIPLFFSFFLILCFPPIFFPISIYPFLNGNKISKIIQCIIAGLISGIVNLGINLLLKTIFS
jgi:hypothetical protein